MSNQSVLSTQQILEIVRKRGLAVVLKDGQPYLQRNGRNEEVTDALLDVLKHHRDKIITLLSREKES